MFLNIVLPDCIRPNGERWPESAACDFTARLPNPILRKTASWIASSSCEWGDTLVTFFGPRVVADLADSEREELSEQLAQLAHSESIQDLMGRSVRDPKISVANAWPSFHAANMASLQKSPKSLNEAVRFCLEAQEKQLMRACN